MMASRGLVNVLYDKEGIAYSASELTASFFELLKAEYTNSMLEVAKWVVNTFDSTSNDVLRNKVKHNLDVWGGEFLSESLVRGSMQT